MYGRALAAAAAESVDEVLAADLSFDREFERFKAAADGGATLVPLYERVMADQLTPVLAYRCLVKEDDREAPSFLFESVVNGMQQGRYSFVGAQPALEVVARGSEVSVLDHRRGTRSSSTVADPLQVAVDLSRDWRPAPAEGLPRIFTGGWVGFCGYDTVRYVYPGGWIEPRSQCVGVRGKLPSDQAPEDDRGLPDLHLALYNSVIVFDHATKLAYVTAWVHLGEHDSVEEAYLAGRRQLAATVASITAAPVPTLLGGKVTMSLSQRPATATSNMTRQQFLDAVDATKEYIQARLCGLDEALERELLADEKERAEHVMLVDLGRNDVGRVANAGSVEVEKLMVVERYSHVMHISSTVTGKLQDGLTCWDALRAALPAGTVSGAPKVRAMQIIDELEVNRRGPYGGGFGHVSFTGAPSGPRYGAVPRSTRRRRPRPHAACHAGAVLGGGRVTCGMDMALALRTMVVPTNPGDNLYRYDGPRPRREWRVYLQAGAGIVADSSPVAEYEETVNKSAALGRAIDLAGERCLRPERAFVDEAR
eukprot:scaffold24.g2930.t1